MRRHMIPSTPRRQRISRPVASHAFSLSRNIGADRPGAQYRQEIGRLGFHEQLVLDPLEGRIHQGGQVALQGGLFLVLNDVVHHELPSAGGGGRIGPGEIGHCDAAVEANIKRKQEFAAAALKSIREIQSTGVETLSRIADCMNRRGEKTPRGGTWTATAVKRVLDLAR